MHSRRPPLPFPANPGYGTGATRRRIDLENRGSRAIARLIDPFHEMDCEVVHDDGKITAVTGVMHRYPTTLCPGANSVLQELVGESIDDDPGKRFYEPSFQRRNCTHLLDLAWLASRHARRGQATCVYEAYVPDERDDPIRLELRRDGEIVHQWTVSRGIVSDPPAVAGLPLLKGFWARASNLFSGDELEAAMVLARAYLIAIGRAYDTQAWAGRRVTENAPLRDRCYAYGSTHGEAGVFLAGHVRDFAGPIVRKD